MNTLATSDPHILAVYVTDETITAQLENGRSVSAPLAWSWRLSEATSEQRNHFEFIGMGEGAHWPDVDEDIGALGMLQGIPARPPKRATANVDSK